jgi:hypothetical protein
MYVDEEKEFGILLNSEIYTFDLDIIKSEMVEKFRNNKNLRDNIKWFKDLRIMSLMKKIPVSEKVKSVFENSTTSDELSGYRILYQLFLAKNSAFNLQEWMAFDPYLEDKHNNDKENFSDWFKDFLIPNINKDKRYGDTEDEKTRTDYIKDCKNIMSILTRYPSNLTERDDKMLKRTVSSYSLLTY